MSQSKRVLSKTDHYVRLIFISITIVLNFRLIRLGIKKPNTLWQFSCRGGGITISDRIKGILHEQRPSHFIRRFNFVSSLIRVSSIRSKQKTLSMSGFCLQRRRDSNPRYLAVQRFSRPPHSTTLPLLCIGQLSFLLSKTVAPETSGQPLCSEVSLRTTPLCGP